MRIRIPPIGVVLLLVGLAGCQNSMSVRIEMLDVAPVISTVHPTTRALDQVKEIACSISDASSGASQTVAAAIVDSLQPELVADARKQRIDEYVGVLKPNFKEFDDVGAKAEKLCQDATFLANENDKFVHAIDRNPGKAYADLQAMYHHTVEVRAVVARAKALSDEYKRFAPRVEMVVSNATTRIRNQSSGDGAERLSRIAMRYAQTAVQVSVQADARAVELMQQVSFGGFFVGGIHKIDPSDPMFHVVLNARPKRNALSEAAVQASGDTSVIIVFDTPTQVRTHEARNDPTQLVRNVAMIIDKVLQVVAKYASIGL